MIKEEGYSEAHKAKRKKQEYVVSGASSKSEEEEEQPKPMNWKLNMVA